ncbi:alpha/beta hydrolase [Nocardioides coralli]|uniref:alpha/beta hydrolase n=1 Tax=Nocardioides coralli TaxID=2872154 RepID=UPI001CA43B7F|nr:alpha/beta hydrolase [Nocardioides coralli]QZY28403.1 alpha/beta hydrolase [Nocardioides coralli]
MSITHLTSTRWRRPVSAALLVALLPVSHAVTAAGAAPPPAAARASESGPVVPTVAPVRWRSCGRGLRPYECATVEVPLDYDRPKGATTEIALARYPATDSRPIGSLFVNPGGPGGDGVGLVLSGFGEFLGESLGGRFDVVGFDPRGVGRSEPLYCFDNEGQLFDFLFSQPIFPYKKKQFRPFFRAYSRLKGPCRAGQRIDEHMSTADVARDLDLLRQAVGDRALSYLGFSYGSHLGNTYANLFPDHVRALVIDGVLDPRLWVAGRQVESDRVATQEEFDEFLRLCDEARRKCAFWKRSMTSKERWNKLARAVRRMPIVFPDGFRYTYDFLIADAASAMYVPEFWGGPGGVADFFDFLADNALRGKKGAAAKASRARDGLLERWSGRRVARQDYLNFFDSYFGNHCADAQYPRAFSRWKAVGRFARAGSRFGPFWWWYNAPCARWPVNEDRYTGPWTATTNKPVLVVGNFFDGVTAYTGAVASDQLLGNSRLLSYAGWGHTAYGRSQCVTDHVNAYLLRGALPPKDTVCPANPSPFLTAAARQARLGRGPVVGLPPPWLLRR